MMDRDLAELLLPWVNDEAFRKTIEAYVTNRLKDRHRALEQESDALSIARAQGAVWELRRLLKLREEVIAHDRK